MEDINNIRLVEQALGEYTWLGWVDIKTERVAEIQNKLREDGRGFLEQLLGYKIIPMDQYSKELHEKYDNRSQ